MIVTRHISLDDDCLEKMEPYVKKHNGNFSAAIREIIDRAVKYRSLENLSTIDNSLFKWILNEIDGMLVPDNIINDFIEPGLINSMAKLERHLNNKFSELEWGINLILKCNNDTAPSEVLMELRGEPQKLKLAASMLSQYLVKKSPESSPLGIRSVFSSDTCMKVELSRSNKKEAIDSLVTFFGSMDEITNAIRNRPDFWKAIIKRHLLSNYNMVTVHKNYFEDLLAGKVPMGEITIETLAKKPIQEIPLKNMLALIKEVYETSRVADRVEIDRESLILFHSYRDDDVIEKLKKSLVALLDVNGHLYDAKSTANMIVLTHRPDVGIKINEIVENLKISRSRVDQELIMFMAFLKGLKDVPDIPTSLTALGRRTGKSLMQEYEQENNIKDWNMENFKKAFEILHAKLQIHSEWKTDGKNLIYTVKKCNIAAGENTFETYICHTIQETFKGAVNYAFGKKAEMEIKRSLTGGDRICEVVIRIP